MYISKEVAAQAEDTNLSAIKLFPLDNQLTWTSTACSEEVVVDFSGSRTSSMASCETQQCGSVEAMRRNESLWICTILSVPQTLG